MATTVGVAVCNLRTSEPNFQSFEVEVHSDTSGNNKVASQIVAGKWDPGTGEWYQTNKICLFAKLTIGTTYYFRVRVLPKKGNPSSWSAWATEVAGDVTAPSVTFTPIITPIDKGCIVFLTPSTSATDVDYYELYQSTYNGAPSNASYGTERPSVYGMFRVTQLNLDDGSVLHYMWARAVDTSGNASAWASIGTYTPYRIYDDAGEIPGSSIGVTGTARDNNKNLFGNPKMDPSGATTIPDQSLSQLEVWGKWSVNNVLNEYRNGSEIRIAPDTSSSAQQWKGFKRFTPNNAYSVRVQVRKGVDDPTPNGNFIVGVYESTNTHILGQVIIPGSAVLSTFTPVFLTVTFNPVPGALYYMVAFENTSTNASFYITQAQLNKGLAPSEYTEDTYLLDAAIYAPEGYAFVDDLFDVFDSSLYINNGDFEASNTLPPPNWSAGSGVLLQYYTTNPQQGVRSLIVSWAYAGFGYGYAKTEVVGTLVPGNHIAVSGYATVGTGAVMAKLILSFTDSNDAPLTGDITASTTNTVWTPLYASGVIPAGAVHAYLSAGGYGNYPNSGHVTVDACAITNLDASPVNITTQYPDLAGGEWQVNTLAGAGAINESGGDAITAGTTVPYNAFAHNTMPSLTDSYAVEANVVLDGSLTTDYAGVIFRYIDSTHFYYCVLRGDNKLELGKWNGTKSAIQTTNLTTNGRAKKIRACISGTSIAVYVVEDSNTTPLISVTDSSIGEQVGVEKVGMYFYQTNASYGARIKDLVAYYIQSAGTLQIPPPPPPPPPPDPDPSRGGGRYTY